MEVTSRFSGSDWFEQSRDLKILLIGAGGIGSNAACALVRQGWRLKVYDFDQVEPQNVGTQLYSIDQVGMFKTEALSHSLRVLGSEPDKIDLWRVAFGRYNPTSHVEWADVIICAVDNMSSRSYIFSQFKMYADEDCLFIDGRMLAEDFQIYTVRRNDEQAMTDYPDTIFNDDEVAEGPCAYRQTAFVGQVIGGIITQVIANHRANLAQGFDYRRVPFELIYNGLSLSLE